jgi:prepilin-type N-terminal cleavage/methylation domain-containing protein
VRRILRRRPGFTLLEILITIAIMLFLFALVAVAAGRMREKARITNTKSLVKRVSNALEVYHALYRNYPSIPVIGDTFPDLCPYSTITPLQADPSFWRGIDLTRQLLIQSNEEFGPSDLDSTGTYLVDAWGNRLKYRKLGRDRYLVWSAGSAYKYANTVANPHPLPGAPTFNDDIGTGDYYVPTPVPGSWSNCGNPTRDIDIYTDPTGVKYIGNNITSKDTDF